jgi:hypothetical protein
LIDLTNELLWPTEGVLSRAIWLKAQSELDVDLVTTALELAGYKPIVGYPLQNADEAIVITCEGVTSEDDAGDGSVRVNYTFAEYVGSHLHDKAYRMALARLRLDWPEGSQVEITKIERGYSAYHAAPPVPDSLFGR